MTFTPTRACGATSPLKGEVTAPPRHDARGLVPNVAPLTGPSGHLSP